MQDVVPGLKQTNLVRLQAESFKRNNISFLRNSSVKFTIVIREQKWGKQDPVALGVHLLSVRNS
jgi:hypothetical protein